MKKELKTYTKNQLIRMILNLMAMLVEAENNLSSLKGKENLNDNPTKSVSD